MKSVTPEQARQVLDFLRDGILPTLQYAGYDTVQAAISRSERVHKLQQAVRPLITEFLNPNPYKDEKKNPNHEFNYTTEHLPRVEEQAVKQLAGLGLTAQPILVPLTGKQEQGADGMMALPYLADLGRKMGIDNPTRSGYAEVTNRVLTALNNSHRFYKYRKAKVDSDHLRLNDEVASLIEKLESESTIPAQPGIIRFHLLPISTGAVYAGYSPRNARTDALLSGNLPLGSAHTGCILLSWTRRLEKWEQRLIDCSADECRLENGEWLGCLYFHFGGDKLRLDVCDAGNALASTGSPVAYLDARPS